MDTYRNLYKEAEQEDSLPAVNLHVPPSPDWVRLPLYHARFTPFILGFLVLVWGAMTLYGSTKGLGLVGTENEQLLLQWGSKDNDLIRAGEYWRLLTATFLHIGLLHLLFNSWALYMFGPLIERYYGPLRFLVIYFIAGLGGSIASFAFSPGDSAGASGAIFGLISALAVYFWQHRRLTGAQGRTQLINAAFLIVLNLGLGVSVLRVDNWGHLGGLIAGAIAGLALAPRYTPGRALSPSERLLEDRITPTTTAAISLALLAATVGTFVLSLVI